MTRQLLIQSLQVPAEIPASTAEFRAIQALVSVTERPRVPHTVRTPVRLANELLAAAEDNDGEAVKRKNEVHKLCEQNRAYAHYRFLKK